MDKKLAAQRVRERLENRLACVLGYQARQLPRLKIGTLIHLAFLLDGTEQTIGGFQTTMGGILMLLGHEVVWNLEPKDREHTDEDAGSEVVN